MLKPLCLIAALTIAALTIATLTRTAIEPALTGPNFGQTKGAPMTGMFVDSSGFRIKLSDDVRPNHYALTIGDVTEIVADHEDNELSHCLLFTKMDILIPRNFTVGEISGCKGSGVSVVKRHEQLIIRDRNLSDVYVLKVRTSEFLFSERMRFQRSGNRKPVETLYYSIELGLVGFTINQRTFLRETAAKSTMN